MSFFDTTPTGRILNRFAKDQEEVDTVLPMHMDPFLQFCLLVTFTIIIISAVFPLMLVAVVIIGVLFTIILLWVVSQHPSSDLRGLKPFDCFFLFMRCSIFQKSIRQMKKMENISRSPCISLTTSTLQGLSTIHAYNTKDSHVKLYDHKAWATVSSFSIPSIQNVSLTCLCRDAGSKSWTMSTQITTCCFMLAHAGCPSGWTSWLAPWPYWCLCSWSLLTTKSLIPPQKAWQSPTPYRLVQGWANYGLGAVYKNIDLCIGAENYSASM